MRASELETKLMRSIERLDGAADKVVKTRNYTKEVQAMRLLKEMIKEQLTNESSSHSTSKTR